jgi:hypothetical protein
LLNVGVIVFSVLCRAFSCSLISYIFCQEESDDDDDAEVKELVTKGLDVGGKMELGQRGEFNFCVLLLKLFAANL